jgi:hypothetical protein
VPKKETRWREGETRSDRPWRPLAINRPIGVSIQYPPLVADVSRRNGQWVWRSIGDRARYPSRIPIPYSQIPTSHSSGRVAADEQHGERRRWRATYPPSLQIPSRDSTRQVAQNRKSCDSLNGFKASSLLEPSCWPQNQFVISLCYCNNLLAPLFILGL